MGDVGHGGDLIIVQNKLVTADVSSLYTIIPHIKGLEERKHYLESDNCLLATQKQFVLRLLKFAMENNYFYYGGAFYLQGTGIPASPTCLWCGGRNRLFIKILPPMIYPILMMPSFFGGGVGMWIPCMPLRHH